MSNRPVPPPGELRDVSVQMVSLVTKGANRRPFKLFKSADFEDEEDLVHRGIGEAIRDGFADLLKHLGMRKDSPLLDPVPIDKQDEEDIDMALTKDELEAIVKAAMAPMEQRLADIAKALSNVAPPMPRSSAKEMDSTNTSPSPTTPSNSGAPVADTPDPDGKVDAAVAANASLIKALEDATQPLMQRLERLERTRGLSNAGVSEGRVKLAKGEEFWGGVFIPEN